MAGKATLHAATDREEAWIWGTTLGTFWRAALRTRVITNSLPTRDVFLCVGLHETYSALRAEGTFLLAAMPCFLDLQANMG
mgnify:CR=1 FL=1